MVTILVETRKRRDGQKKKIGKAKEKRKNEKVNRAKYEEVNGQGRKKAGNAEPRPQRGFSRQS